MREIITKRTANSATYDMGDGTHQVKCTRTQQHYRTDPRNPFTPMARIQRDIQPLWAGQALTCPNSYEVRFFPDGSARFHRAGKYFDMQPGDLVWTDDDGGTQLIATPHADDILRQIDNAKRTVMWDNLFGQGLHFGYIVGDSEFKKILVIDEYAKLPACTLTGSNPKLTLTMDFQWDAEPGLTLPEGTTPAEDLEAAGMENIQFNDEHGRPVWYFQKPKAWDSWDEKAEVHDCENCNKLCLKYDTGSCLKLCPDRSEADQRFIDTYPDAWETRDDGEKYLVVPSPLLDDDDNWLVDSDKAPIRSFAGEWKCNPECVVTHHYEQHNPPQAERDGCWATEAANKERRENHEVPMTWAVIRSGDNFSAKLSVSKETLEKTNLVYPVYIDVDITEEEVAAGTDDGYASAAGFVAGGGNFNVGRIGVLIATAFCRFVTVPVPQGATITEATLTCYCMTTSLMAPLDTVSVSGNDVDDAVAPTTVGEVESLVLTTASDSQAAGLSYLDVVWDVTDIISEIVGRSGWESDNAIQFKLYQEGSSDKKFASFAAYEHASQDPPRLNISYEAAAEPDGPIGSQVIVTT